MDIQNLSHRLKLTSVSLVLIGLSTIIVPSVHSAEMVNLEYKFSEVSFVGDENFVTGRYERKPLRRNHIWNERISFSGGAMYFSELVPGYYYTGQNAGIETFRDIYNRNPTFKRRDMSITVGDVKKLSNETGDYYLAAKEGTTSNCGMAKQFSGDVNPDGGMIAVGNRVATVFFCKNKSWGDTAKVISHIQDIMDRARYDEGKLNKVRAALK